MGVQRLAGGYLFIVEATAVIASDNFDKPRFEFRHKIDGEFQSGRIDPFLLRSGKRILKKIDHHARDNEFLKIADDSLRSKGRADLEPELYLVTWIVDALNPVRK